MGLQDQNDNIGACYRFYYRQGLFYIFVGCKYCSQSSALSFEKNKFIRNGWKWHLFREWKQTFRKSFSVRKKAAHLWKYNAKFDGTEVITKLFLSIYLLTLYFQLTKPATISVLQQSLRQRPKVNTCNLSNTKINTA